MRQRYADAELALPEIPGIGCSRKYKGRPDAPSDLAPLWREQEGRVDATQSVDAGGLQGIPGRLGDGKRLIDDGGDPTGDEIPIFRDAERNHGLDVNDILGAVGWADVEVPVFLNGNADEAGDGILRLFSQLLGT